MVSHEFFRRHLDSEALAVAEQYVRTVVSLVLDLADLQALLRSFRMHSTGLYSHAAAVSLLSVMIGLTRGWTSPVTLSTIALCGLFHDIGKKELPPSLLEKPMSELSPTETLTYQSHVTRGAELLSQVGGIPSDVVLAVAQHHETMAGTGYPTGLKGDQLFAFARVVGLADAFYYLALGDSKQPALPAPQALLRLRAGHHDPSLLEALAKLVS